MGTIIKNYFSQDMTALSKNPWNLFILLIKKILSEKNNRIIIYLSGIPGSGKTTLTKALTKRFSQVLKTDLCSSIQMDAFHYPRETLHLTIDHKTSFKRRGSCWTFNVNVTNLRYFMMLFAYLKINNSK